MNSELEFAKTGATWLLTWSWQALLGVADVEIE